MSGMLRTWGISAGIFLAAFALRLAASLDDLWLDEIWSWWLIQQHVRSPLDVLISLRHENNHFLNTWWMQLLGPHADAVWYRLPPVILGSLTVLLARAAVARNGSTATWMVTVLTLPSYLLIHYSSEARGYAYQVFFALAAYVLLERLLVADFRPAATDERTTRAAHRDRWQFGLCCVLGCLGHPGFLLMFLALGGWALLAAWQGAKSWSRAFSWSLAIFIGPTVVLLLLWIINLSQLENGGGPQENPWLVAVSTLSLTVGGPELGELSLLIGLFAAVAAAIHMLRLIRNRDLRWICWGLMIVIPAALIAVLGRKEVYPRYFLGTVVLLDLALAEGLAVWWKQGKLGRIAVAVIVSASLVGNGLQLARLYRDGRGQAQDVVKFLRDQTPAGPIVVGSDPVVFRHFQLLSYYSYRLGLGERMAYVGPAPWPPPGPQWVMVHTLSREEQFAPVLSDPQGRSFALRRVFPYAGLSGWQTGIYENVTAQPPDQTP